MIDKSVLRLELDSLFDVGYFYTKFDIGDEGHSITIDTDNEEEFLDAFAAEFREHAENLLEHPEIEN